MHIGKAYAAFVKYIFIVGCGSAMHSGMVGKYLIEALARTPVIVDIASEFRYRDPLVSEDDLVVIISQSGEFRESTLPRCPPRPFQ